MKNFIRIFDLFVSPLLFTPVCLSVARQGVLNVLKGIPQLVIPISQRLGGQIFPPRQHTFFLAPFVFVRAQEKNTTSLVPWPCRVPTCVVLPKLDYEHTVPA